MQLEILTPEKRLFHGDVYGIQLPGISGSFEVLDRHAPLVSALGKGTLKVLVDKSGGNASLYEIQGGFIEVIGNKASVLVEGAVEK
jgi:F-type H+-transporting ATPase subunit epsilon